MAWDGHQRIDGAETGHVWILTRWRTKLGAVPPFPCHLAAERHEPPPAVARLPTVKAESALEAVQKLARSGRLPVAGDTFWVRVVTDVDPNGVTSKAISVPLTPEFTIPLDWQPPDEVFD